MRRHQRSSICRRLAHAAVAAAMVMVVLGSSSTKNGDTCSLNGQVNPASGACECDPAWKGAACDELDVQHVASADAVGYRNASGYNSWGGNAIFEAGVWHLFAAQFENHCRLDHWGTNSAIIRAESAVGPQGPFHYVETVVPAFSHNPTVRRVRLRRQAGTTPLGVAWSSRDSRTAAAAAT
jgi:hypothetical protein